MSEPNKEQVFLSFASEDVDIVSKVYDGLIRRGLNIWFSPKDMRSGDWMLQLKEALHQSRYFVLCISEIAIKKLKEKKGVQRTEFAYAYEIAMSLPEDTFTIIPVRLEDCDRGDHRIARFHHYDLFDDLEKGLDTLAVHHGGCSLSDARARDERTEEEKMIESFMGKAEAFYYSGEYEDALAAYEKAIHFKPDCSSAWNNKGSTLNKLDRFKDAIVAFEEAIKIKYDNSESWYNKGNALVGLKRYEEAIESYNKAIDFKNDYHEAWNNKGNVFATLGRYEEAIKAYEAAIAIKTDKFDSWNNKGKALYELNRLEEAIKAYDKAIELNKNYHEAWVNKGNSLLILGCKKKAVEAFDKAIKIKPDYFEAWHNKGFALLDLGQKEDAIKAFDKVLEIKPDYQEALELKKELFSKI